MLAVIFRTRVRIKTGIRMKERRSDTEHKHDVASRMANTIAKNLPVGLNRRVLNGIWERIRDTLQRIPTSVRGPQ
jgi:hypothetical protein